MCRFINYDYSAILLGNSLRELDNDSAYAQGLSKG